MRIITLDLIEDSNEFTLAELEGVPATLPWTVSGREVKLSGKVVGLRRVDRIPKHQVVDVPARQGEQLVALGLARLATAEELPSA